jgi:hypothetical protein
MRKTSLVSIGIVQLFIFTLYGYAFFSQAATVTVDVTKGKGGGNTVPEDLPLIPHFWTGIDLAQAGFNTLTFYADSLEGQGVFIYDASTLGSPPKVLASTTTISWHNAVATADRWFIDDILTVEPQVDSGGSLFLWIGTHEGGAYRYNWTTEKIDRHATVKNTGCHGSASSIAGNTIQFTSIDCAYNTLCDSSSGCSYGSTQLDFTNASDLVLQLNSELHVIDGCTRDGGTGSCWYKLLNNDGGFIRSGRVNGSISRDINKFVIRAGLGSNVVNDVAVDGNTIWFATGQKSSTNESKDGGFSRLTPENKMESFSFATTVQDLDMVEKGPSMGTQSLHISGDTIYIGGQAQGAFAKGLLLKCGTGQSFTCLNYGGTYDDNVYDVGMLDLSACVMHGMGCMRNYYDVVAEEIGSTLYLFTAISTLGGANYYTQFQNVTSFIPATFNGDGLKIMDSENGFTVICSLHDGVTGTFDGSTFTLEDDCMSGVAVNDWLVSRGKYYLIETVSQNGYTLTLDRKEDNSSGLQTSIVRIRGNIFKEHLDPALDGHTVYNNSWPQTPYPQSLSSNRIHDISVVKDGGTVYVWMGLDGHRPRNKRY